MTVVGALIRTVVKNLQERRSSQVKHELQNKSHCFELWQIKRIAVQGEKYFPQTTWDQCHNKTDSNSFNILNLYIQVCQFLHTPMTVREVSEWVHLQSSSKSFLYSKFYCSCEGGHCSTTKLQHVSRKRNTNHRNVKLCW